MTQGREGIPVPREIFDRNPACVAALGQEREDAGDVDESEPVKQLLESVNSVYSADPGDGTYNRPPVTETVEHPVVRTHRHTGRKGLFISTSAVRLTGVTDAESKALLPFLLAHASSPNYTVSFGWKPGDFVLWDNQATWHYAVNDYDGPRVYRKVIAG